MFDLKIILTSSVVEIAQVYFYYRIPTLFVILYESILKRYLEAMGFFNFLSYSAFIQLFVHIICLFVFMYVFEMNYLGVAIAIGVSSCVGLAMVFVYFKMISKSQLHLCRFYNCF